MKAFGYWLWIIFKILSKFLEYELSKNSSKHLYIFFKVRNRNRFFFRNEFRMNGLRIGTRFVITVSRLSINIVIFLNFVFRKSWQHSVFALCRFVLFALYFGIGEYYWLCWWWCYWLISNWRMFMKPRWLMSKGMISISTLVEIR